MEVDLELEDLLQEANALVAVISERTNQTSYDEVSTDTLRTHVGNFVIHQMNMIETQDLFRNLVIKELINQIATHQLSTSDLINVYKTIGADKTSSSETLLELFKPTTNASSPLVPPKSEDEKDDDLSSTMNNLNPKQMEALVLMMTKMSKIGIEENK